MFAKMGEGWAMAKASLAVLQRYPKLAVFPVISGAIFILVVGAILVSIAPEIGLFHRFSDPIWDRLGETDAGQIKFYVAAFAVIYVLTAIAIFLNVALIHCALRCHAGEEPSVSDGISAAVARLPQILGWALIATTVGVVLNMIEGFLRDKLGFLGSLIGSAFEFGWSLVTFFVLPVLVVERLGPIAAVRRSSAILKEKWGQSVAGGARFGLIGALFTLIAAGIGFVGLMITLSYGPKGFAGLGPLLIGGGILFFLAVMIVLQALNSIFLSGVYLYATTGRVPATLNAQMVQNAFRPKG